MGVAWLLWVALLAMLATDWVWARTVDVWFEQTGRMACVCGLLMGLSGLARMIPRYARMSGMIEAAALWIGFSSIGCVLTYLAARSPFPLRDEWLDGLDRLAGLDWLAWQRWVCGHPCVHAVLHAAYGSLPLQIICACCVLPHLGDGERGRRLLGAAMVAIVVTSGVFLVLPAAGPFMRYGLGDRADWMSDLLILRGGGSGRFALPELKGLVNCPSYHTVMAVLFARAYRGTGALGIGMALLNVLMVISTPSEGSHYFVDIVAGAAVAWGSLAFVRRAECRLAAWRPVGPGHRPADTGRQSSTMVA